jgi:hypothetical protein
LASWTIFEAASPTATSLSDTTSMSSTMFGRVARGALVA